MLALHFLCAFLIHAADPSEQSEGDELLQAIRTQTTGTPPPTDDFDTTFISGVLRNVAAAGENLIFDQEFQAAAWCRANSVCVGYAGAVHPTESGHQWVPLIAGTVDRDHAPPNSAHPLSCLMVGVVEIEGVVETGGQNILDVKVKIYNGSTPTPETPCGEEPMTATSTPTPTPDEQLDTTFISGVLRNVAAAGQSVLFEEEFGAAAWCRENSVCVGYAHADAGSGDDWVPLVAVDVVNAEGVASFVSCVMEGVVEPLSGEGILVPTMFDVKVKIHNGATPTPETRCVADGNEDHVDNHNHSSHEVIWKVQATIRKVGR